MDNGDRTGKPLKDWNVMKIIVNAGDKLVAEHFLSPSAGRWHAWVQKLQPACHLRPNLYN